MDNYRIIILFSDVEFEKPILLNETVYEESNYFSKKEFYAPRSCNTVDFLKWMHESFARIPTLQINPLDITVINNNAK